MAFSCEGGATEYPFGRQARAGGVDVASWDGWGREGMISSRFRAGTDAISIPAGVSLAAGSQLFRSSKTSGQGDGVICWDGSYLRAQYNSGDDTLRWYCNNGSWGSIYTDATFVNGQYFNHSTQWGAGDITMVVDGVVQSDTRSTGSFVFGGNNYTLNTGSITWDGERCLYALFADPFTLGVHQELTFDPYSWLERKVSVGYGAPAAGGGGPVALEGAALNATAETSTGTARTPAETKGAQVEAIAELDTGAAKTPVPLTGQTLDATAELLDGTTRTPVSLSGSPVDANAEVPIGSITIDVSLGGVSLDATAEILPGRTGADVALQGAPMEAQATIEPGDATISVSLDGAPVDATAELATGYTTIQPALGGAFVNATIELEPGRFVEPGVALDFKGDPVSATWRPDPISAIYRPGVGTVRA